MRRRGFHLRFPLPASRFPASWGRALFLLLMFAIPGAASADIYRVDLIVFLDKSASAEQGRAPMQPDTGKAIEITNLAALKLAGIEILPDEQFALTDQWQRLKTAKRYQPLIRLGWLQKKPPSDRSVILRLKWGEGFSSSNGEGLGASLLLPVDGSIALLLGNYLNLDLDLVYNQKNADGTASSWHLREKRRMKRDELHHLDSPKLGALARISKLAPR